jgi:hypothetical protein
LALHVRRIHHLTFKEVDFLATTRTQAPAPAKPARTVKSSTKAEPGRDETARSRTVYTVTVPFDQAVTAAAIAVKVPVAVARRVVPTRGGLPVYLGLGGLAVVGAVEWPLAAAAGVSFAALRRWGPLRPAPAAGEKSAAPHAAATTEG